MFSLAWHMISDVSSGYEMMMAQSNGEMRRASVGSGQSDTREIDQDR